MGRLQESWKAHFGRSSRAKAAPAEPAPASTDTTCTPGQTPSGERQSPPGRNAAGAPVATAAGGQPRGADDDDGVEKPPSVKGSSDRDVSIRELWDVAYEKLKSEDGELIRRYEAALPRVDGPAEKADPALEPKASRREHMRAVLELKIDEAKRDAWKLKFGASEVMAKDLVEPALSVVDWANDYITNAVSANAYASIAWSAVSLLLPLLLNPSKQATSLASGMEEVASLIAQSRMWEELYIRRYEAKAEVYDDRFTASHAEYKTTLAELYRRVLKYNITSYCYYSRSSAFRLGLDMVKWHNWTALLDDVRKQKLVFASVSIVWRDMKFDEDDAAATRRHAESVTLWETVALSVQGLRKAVEDAQADDRRAKLLDWLSDVDPSVAYNLARKKHGKGTGEWLLHDSRKFRTWRKFPSSLLWIHGKAGSGKSVLSSSVIKHLRDQHRSNPQAALAYFYFSFADVKKQNVIEMLASLTKQLCSYRPDTPQLIRDFAQYKERGERPDIETLEAALAATVQGFSAVYIVIDGLDECPALNRERGTLLDSLHRIVTSTPDSVHVLCTSRREADIDTVMSRLLSPPARNSIDLAAYRQTMDRDIGLYIDLTLESHEFGSWPASVKTEVKERLIDKADGMFLYVSCQFDELRKFSSTARVRQALENLPTGIDATYDRMLRGSIEPNFQTEVISMLKWLCFSSSPLTVAEMAEIFVLRDMDVIDPVQLKSERLINGRYVLRYLGSFVAVSDRIGGHADEATVVIAHFSIKEYLTSQRLRMSEGPAATFSFTELEARLHIARASLAYHVGVTCVHYRQEDHGRFVNPLSLTATREWFGHLENVSRALWPSEVVDVVKQALAFRSLSLFLVAISGSDFISSFTEDMWQPHLLVSALGLRQLTDLVISTADYLTQEEVNECLTRVVLARSRSLVEYPPVLRNLEGDAPSDPEALDVTTMTEDRGIARFMLPSTRGADVNAGDAKSAYPLHDACNEGSLELVLLLLSRRRADVNAQGGIYGNALQAACCSPYARQRAYMVRILLRHGANVNASGGKYGSALQAAARRMHNTHLVQLLLDHGANVNQLGGKYETALQAAAVGGDISTVQLLLQHGAEVNISGGEYGCVFQAACSSGDDVYDSEWEHSEYDDSLEDFDLEEGDLEDFDSEEGDLEAGNSEEGEGGGLHDGDDDDSPAHRHDSASDDSTRYMPRVEDGRGTADDELPAKTHLAQLLLKYKANVHIEGGHWESAWHAAAASPTSFESWKKLMLLLLDQGVDVNDARGRPQNAATALHAVLQRRLFRTLGLGSSFDDQLELDVLQKIGFLLDHGADPNLAAGVYGFPLQAACAAHYEIFMCTVSEARVATLLDRCLSIDVNAQGGQFGCALQAAAYSGQINSVKLLLSKGAHVNLRGGEYGSALNAAIVQGYWDIVEVLLQAGAQPDCWLRSEPDEEWLRGVRENDGQRAAERYCLFWEKQLVRKPE